MIFTDRWPSFEMRSPQNRFPSGFEIKDEMCSAFELAEREMIISCLLDSTINLLNTGIERSQNAGPEVLVPVIQTLIDVSINNVIDKVLFFLVSEYSTMASVMPTIGSPFGIDCQPVCPR
jgi:hypothetical protein